MRVGENYQFSNSSTICRRVNKPIEKVAQRIRLARQLIVVTFSYINEL